MEEVLLIILLIKLIKMFNKLIKIYNQIYKQLLIILFNK